MCIVVVEEDAKDMSICSSNLMYVAFQFPHEHSLSRRFSSLRAEVAATSS